jgi:hypothetical protein
LAAATRATSHLFDVIRTSSANVARNLISTIISMSVIATRMLISRSRDIIVSRGYWSPTMNPALVTVMWTDPVCA